MNLTFTVPEGSTNHGNPNLLCTPAKWYDLIIFFFANYLAHAASVIIEPGQSLSSSGLSVLLTLILPGTGVVRAVRAIFRHAATETKNPLKRAARAGALCVVLKRPKNGRYSLQSMRRRRGPREPEEGQKATETDIDQSTTKAANQEPDQISPTGERREIEAVAGSDSVDGVTRSIISIGVIDCKVSSADCLLSSSPHHQALLGGSLQTFTKWFHQKLISMGSTGLRKTPITAWPLCHPELP